jgi:hypothetical protein
MKYSLFIAALCIAVLSGCTKQTDTATETKMRALHQRISTEPSPYLQKAYYTTLAGAEKAALWRVHVSETAARLTLNPAQKAIVNEAYNLLTEENFGNDDALRKNNQYIIWQQKMFETFDRVTAYRLFASMKQDAAAGIQPDNAALDDCGCSETSDWCNVGTGGLRFYCKKGGCKVVPTDCGTFWRYDCDGGCAMLKPINPF